MKKQTPLERYLSLCKNGELESDHIQKEAAEKLQHLHDSLVGYKPNSESWLTSFKERLKINNKPSKISSGLYIYGPVGRGKSMLMDLFFENAPVTKKRRVHFNLQNARKFDFNHLKALKTKEYVKKITV